MSPSSPPTGVLPERFIPLQRTTVRSLCMDQLTGVLSPEELAHVAPVADLLEALFHHRFHANLERLKDIYAPFDPDLDARLVPTVTPEERASRHAQLTTELEAVLTAANYEPLSREDLEAALDEESLFRIRLHVDFDDFDHVLFYRRGEDLRTEEVSTFFGLKTRKLTFRNYDRVVVFVTFRGPEHFAAKGRSELMFDPGATLVKMFRNVPRADLEMLFPNTEVRMKTKDKVVLGVPAAVSGVVLLTTKLGPTLLLVASMVSFWMGLKDQPIVLDQAALVILGAGFATIGGFLFQQVSKFQNRKIRFMKTLSDSLYFRNLDNNAGVFHRLIDAAEEEECKEALLAWTFLLKATEPLDEAGLDLAVEAALHAHIGEAVDFEVSDALAKLVELDLVTVHDNGVLDAVLPTEAARRLDARWDGLYRYA